MSQDAVYFNVWFSACYMRLRERLSYYDLDEDAIHDGILNSAKGDCLLVVGDEDVVKVHYHTDTPWKVLEYAATQGDIHTIIIENMERQSNGLHG